MCKGNATLITVYSYGYSVWGIVYLHIRYSRTSR